MDSRRNIFRNPADDTSGIMIGGLGMTSKSCGRIIGPIELVCVGMLGYMMATNCVFGCDSLKVYGKREAPTPPSLTSIASLAPGWGGVVVGISDQSFAGWEVAIGDADNDGKNKIAVATGKGARAVRGTSYMVVLKKNGIISIQKSSWGPSPGNQHRQSDPLQPLLVFHY